MHAQEYGWPIYVNGTFRGEYDLYPTRLVRESRAVGAEPIFFATWALRNNGMNEEQQGLVTRAYSYVGRMLHTLVSQSPFPTFFIYLKNYMCCSLMLMMPSFPFPFPSFCRKVGPVGESLLRAYAVVGGDIYSDDVHPGAISQCVAAITCPLPHPTKEKKMERD